jgi:protein-L-isoaspartate(D-aspartate) O-methyltransferase
MKNLYPYLEISGITGPKVLQDVRSLPRELFVPQGFQKEAYFDSTLPIDCGQTISQPFIVAYMTEQLDLKKDEKVLEIGTGSGFQTAVLAQLVSEVYTVEIYPELSKKAQRVLSRLGFQNVHYKIGDGKEGWEEFSPFDAIIITAVTKEIPPLLLEQLKVGGRMILSLELENGKQYLILVKKLERNKSETKILIQVRFVTLL